MEKITVLINTLNEEKNIANCLESVKWADEIIIVDMHSDDNTTNIARKYTQNIYMHKRVGYVEPARQFGIEKATNDWVLIVDADEIVPIELANKLRSITKLNNCDIVYIPHINYFFGKRMNKTGWGPFQDMHPRFFRKTKVTFNDKIHSVFKYADDSNIYKINDEACAFIHFNYLDVEHFLTKLNRYTTIEARNMFESQQSIPTIKIPILLVKEFIYRYIYKSGYKDGFQGFALSTLMVMYKLSSLLKLSIIRKFNSSTPLDQINNLYDELAKEEIAKYKCV